MAVILLYEWSKLLLGAKGSREPQFKGKKKNNNKQGTTKGLIRSLISSKPVGQKPEKKRGNI